MPRERLMDDDFPSEQEFFNGVRDDGRPLKYPSAEFTPGPTKLFSTEPAEPPVVDAKLTQIEKDAARLHYEIDQRLMEDLDAVAYYGKRMMELGLSGMEEHTQRKAKENPASHGREPADSATDDANTAKPDAPRSRTGAGRGKGSDDLKLSQLIALGQQGAKLVASVAEQRAAIAHKLVEQSSKLDIRHSFMQDRAVAVIYTLMLHLDKEFQEMGFGAWMPFRWPDQWIGFCGVLTRVLAANGLIHGKHAETYRKLLDETPPVEFKGTLKERIRESKTPEPLGKCKSVQGARTMSELLEKVKSTHEQREAKQRFWDTVNIPKPETS